jgi:16S rRNA (guanine527-N7)-methyltransferase
MEKAKENLELITRYFSDFSPVQTEQLIALEALYKDWNSKINVISRKDEDSLYDKHILHSLSIAATFDFQDGMNVLDIGTGGGFPGIPLAIFFPGVKFCLADSIGKKIKVVQAVADAIGLKNVTTQHTRAEDIKNKKFEVVVSRAVAPLKDLWRWGKPLLKRAVGKGQRASELPVPNGLICLKGGDLTQEISESGLRPGIMEVYEIFDLDVFKEKYILYVPLP